jgi:hypothetical protein
LLRGVYDQHGDRVVPRGLQQVFPWNARWPENRLGLVGWLFDAKNPLTARVLVNRIWQMHFGKGIVETAEDFGVQGSVPTHPELLDLLAADLIASGWDLKKLQKKIVMSGTYRQSTDITPELLAKDPTNKWLARGTRIRMTAEMVRDNALAASGLLVDKVGGPSTYPYQPRGIWDGLSQHAEYPHPDQVPQDDLHRRSMYSFIKRNAGHPAMAVFDFPDRSVTSVRRQTSNTPLQALVLLNDPQYVEAARAMALRALTLGSSGDEQVRSLFRLATRRPPQEDELQTLLGFYQQELELARAAPQQGDAFLSVGVSAARPHDTDSATLSAMTKVAMAAMNSPDAFTIR